MTRDSDIDFGAFLKTDAGIAYVVDRFEAELFPKAMACLRAHGAPVLPLKMNWNLAFETLVPQGDETAVLLFGLWADLVPANFTTPVERIFAARSAVALLLAAIEWRRLPSSALMRSFFRPALAETRIGAFRRAQPMQALRIEQNIKTEMRRQGWPV
jgi:hypothetical protein